MHSPEQSPFTMIIRESASIWWSCRGTAPRVRKAGLVLSPGSASNLSWALGLLETGIPCAATSVELSGYSRSGVLAVSGTVDGWRADSGDLSRTVANLN